jgi:DNA-binding IclR family transcriptional regulator
MPRALSRDEQAILAFVRRTDVALPIPELAAQLGLEPAAAQTACAYLVERGLLQAAVYAVTAPANTKQPAAVR